MSKTLQKSAFLVISTYNHASGDNEYLFMTASDHSGSPGKLRIYGGMIEEHETIAEGLWRELSEEISPEAADILINDHTPHYLCEALVTFDREDWHDTYDYAYGVKIPYDTFLKIADQAQDHRSTEVNAPLVLNQRDVLNKLRNDTINLGYSLEKEALVRSLQLSGQAPILQINLA